MFNNHGSLWRKWDLHVHTPLDHEWINGPALNTNEEKKHFAQEYIAFAKSENISVLAITDHNFCNKLENSLLPYISEEAERNSITILPGFEITVKDGSGIHLLVIFKEQTDIGRIYDIVKRLFPVNTELLPNNGQIPVSNKSIDELYEILEESRLEYLIIFAHADRDNGVLDKGTIGGTRRLQEWKKSFIRICQLSKSPNDYPDNSFIGKVVRGTDTNYKRDIAFICASDCRSINKANLDDGRHYLGQKFTWIKANPTLEGLREIQYEHILRVQIQAEYPNTKIPYEVIKEVRFILDNYDDKSYFTSEPIKLNPDLNVVIGGKSSGKSLLLYHIANTVDSKQTYQKEDVPEEKKRDKYGFKKNSIDFEVVWANGTKQLLSNNEQSNNSNYSILYIPQSYIQKLSDTEGRKTRKEVGKIIREILLQKEQYYKYYSDFITEVKRLDSTRENLIQQYVNAFETHKNSVDHIKEIGDKSAIEKYIKELQHQVESLKQKSEVTPDIQEKYSLNRERLQQLNTNQFNLRNDLEKIRAFKYSYDNLSTNIRTLSEQLLSELKNETVHQNMSEVLNQLSMLQDISRELDSRFLNETNSIILKSEAVINEEKESTNQILLPISQKFKDKEQIEKIEQQIADEFAKIQRINAYQEEVTLKAKQKDGAKVALLEEYKKTYAQYIAIIEKLNKRSDEIGDLTLKGSVKFYTKRFYERLRGAINNRVSNKIIEENRLFSDEADIHDIPNIEEMLRTLSSLFDLIVNEEIVFKNGFYKKDLLNILFKDDFFDYWEILSGKDEIANMSPGKAGLVLLKLLIELSESKCPILIDQPEDNLDNRSIYTDLVQYIRDKKPLRQFIVVTHNPNIVVGADADNVIVANQNDQDPKRRNKNYQFDYITGALEYSSNRNESDDNILTSMGIREHVTEILEGGEEAFQKRESKYRYYIQRNTRGTKV